jgi:hypothetical protein
MDFNAAQASRYMLTLRRNKLSPSARMMHVCALSECSTADSRPSGVVFDIPALSRPRTRLWRTGTFGFSSLTRRGARVVNGYEVRCATKLLFSQDETVDGLHNGSKPLICVCRPQHRHDLLSSGYGGHHATVSATLLGADSANVWRGFRMGYVGRSHGRWPLQIHWRGREDRTWSGPIWIALLSATRWISSVDGSGIVRIVTIQIVTSDSTDTLQPWIWGQHALPKRRYLPIRINGVTA